MGQREQRARRAARRTGDHLFGPLLLTAAFADRLAAASGAVVNVASVLSWLPIGRTYSVSKAAL
ncbi:hypothetical protein GCM10027047_38790 [Rhodococcus aerolatus]